MSDLLLEIGKNRHARKIVGGMGVPLPQALERALSPWESKPLAGRTVAFKGTDRIRQMIQNAGAQILEHPSEGVYGLVFDATEIRDINGLRAAYEFFHPLLSQLSRCGRVVVISTMGSESVNEATVQSALDGFTRSMAKEIGRRGATANLIRIEKGAENHIEGVLRFLLSSRSAFLTAQPITVKASAHEISKKWEKSLDGKVVLVTGAGRGIGRATAQLLAQEGAYVICGDRPEDHELVTAVANEVKGAALLVDVSSPDASETIVREIKKHGEGIDAIIHNAGITRDKTLAKMKPEFWDQAIEVNLAAVMRINERLLAEKLIRDEGRIICLSSVAGIAGNVGQTNYSASKAGLIGYVSKLAQVLAPQNIMVNAVAPGFIETRLTAKIPLVIREAGRRLSALGQGGTPRDVGDVITFLTTPSSQGISGQVIRVCGGALIGA
jgi:3-oxoacyl-[acyl-carrier protein] reductase